MLWRGTGRNVINKQRVYLAGFDTASACIMQERNPTLLSSTFSRMCRVGSRHTLLQGRKLEVLKDAASHTSLFTFHLERVFLSFFSRRDPKSLNLPDKIRTFPKA